MINLDGQGNETSLFNMDLQLFALADEENDINIEDDEDLDEDLHENDDLDEDDPDDEPGENEKLFSQAEVDEMIQKRVARANKKEKDFVARQAKRYKMSEDAFIQKMEDEQYKRDLELQARGNGLTKQEDIDNFVNTEFAKKPQGKPYEIQEKEFIEAYPNVDLAKLDKSEDFIKFLRNSRADLDLKDVYANFIELVDKAKSQAYLRKSSKNNRASNAGNGGNITNDKTYGLSKSQLNLCKANGIKPKDFAKDYKAGRKMMH